jgi:hypothetical protein
LDNIRNSMSKLPYIVIHAILYCYIGELRGFAVQT